MNTLELVPSKFEVQEHYQAGFGEPYEVYAYGEWYLEGKEIPLDLSAVFGGGVEEIDINLMAIMRTDDESWRENQPFLVGLCIRVDGELKILAERELSLGHIWSRNQEHGEVVTRMPLLNGATFGCFCAELFAEVLANVLRRAKAMVRWDGQGVVITVNIGATYISTREHAVDVTESAFAASEYVKVA